MVLACAAVALCQAELPVLYEVNQPNQNVVVFRGAEVSLAQAKGLLGQGAAIAGAPPPPYRPSPPQVYRPAPGPPKAAAYAVAPYPYALPARPPPLVVAPAPAPLVYPKAGPAYAEDPYADVREYVCS